MILIGILDSPYVRRVAICMKVLGLAFEHRPLSVFADFDAIRQINPVVKVPTLITADGQVLMDSTLILSFLEQLAPNAPGLIPASGPERLRALCLTGLALAACEKAVQLVYERRLRPEEKQHQPWVDRVVTQIHGAWQSLEESLQEGQPDVLTVAGISIAVAWSFTRMMIPDVITTDRYPDVDRFTQLAERQPVFLATPQV
ncbi:glutathione S-transferase N-terminal domain-containing protein [Acerihabitans sp. TG2]|uniref:glutathione S-transferase n=1 Tax=Acerihabitans sp. TG2 TaxID=3096008 RepID=UPI002B22CA7B|nr:glutathione S-transferase N-terminal domain-containing protein [Acerihabitans sp. TG2]MEA9390729.1 glutathione S-transferase N-terminal domain-containing protein [Acerihabitans sp. TG2]